MDCKSIIRRFESDRRLFRYPVSSTRSQRGQLRQQGTGRPAACMRVDTMKYILLIYAAEGVWPPEEHAEALAESIRLCHTLAAQGQYVAAAPLQPASTAVSVRLRDGKPAVCDGPFAETKEQLAGYFLIDVESLDEAIAIAAQIPGTRRGTTEVRPLLEVTGLP